MDQALVKTNIKIPLLIGLVSGALLYGAVVYIPSADLAANIGVFAFIGVVTALYSIAKAKVLVLTGSAVEVRGMFLPSRKQVMPLNDLMAVKAGKLLGVRSLALRASMSSDEKQTMSELHDSIRGLQGSMEKIAEQPRMKGLMSGMSHAQQEEAKKKAVSQFVKNLNGLFIHASVYFVSAEDAQRAAEMLQPYVDTNLRDVPDFEKDVSVINQKDQRET